MPNLSVAGRAPDFRPRSSYDPRQVAEVVLKTQSPGVDYLPMDNSTVFNVGYYPRLLPELSYSLFRRLDFTIQITANSPAYTALHWSLIAPNGQLLLGGDDEPAFRGGIANLTRLGDRVGQAAIVAGSRVIVGREYSTDNGTSYTAAAFNSGSPDVRRLAVSPSDSNRIALSEASGDTAVYVSTDNGSNYTRRFIASGYVPRGVAWIGTTIITCANSEIRTSIDDGVTWVTQTDGTANGIGDVASSSTRAVAVTLSGNGELIYSDNATSWTTVASPDATPRNRIHYGQGWWLAWSDDSINDLIASPDGENWQLITGPGYQLSGVGDGDGEFLLLGTEGEITRLPMGDTEFQLIPPEIPTGGLTYWVKAR